MTLRVLRALLCAKVNGGLDSRLRGNDGVARGGRVGDGPAEGRMVGGAAESFEIVS